FPVKFVFSRLWARRQTIGVEGVHVDTLSLDDLLIVLSVQLARDAWHGKTKLGKICDIAHVIRDSHAMDWDRIFEQTRQLRIERVLQFAILLTTNIFQIPRPAVRWLADERALKRVLIQAADGLFEGASDCGHLFHFQIREHWRDRLYPYYRDLPHYF